MQPPSAPFLRPHIVAALPLRAALLLPSTARAGCSASAHAGCFLDALSPCFGRLRAAPATAPLLRQALLELWCSLHLLLPRTRRVSPLHHHGRGHLNAPVRHLAGVLPRRHRSSARSARAGHCWIRLRQPPARRLATPHRRLCAPASPRLGRLRFPCARWQARPRPAPATAQPLAGAASTSSLDDRVAPALPPTRAPGRLAVRWLRRPRAAPGRLPKLAPGRLPKTATSDSARRRPEIGRVWLAPLPGLPPAAPPLRPAPALAGFPATRPARLRPR
ncbi:hypothetical protein VPH35_072420 [Triticum aestivum]